MGRGTEPEPERLRNPEHHPRTTGAGRQGRVRKERHPIVHIRRRLYRRHLWDVRSAADGSPEHPRRPGRFRQPAAEGARRARHRGQGVEGLVMDRRRSGVVRRTEPDRRDRRPFVQTGIPDRGRLRRHEGRSEHRRRRRASSRVRPDGRDGHGDGAEGRDPSRDQRARVMELRTGDHRIRPILPTGHRRHLDHVPRPAPGRGQQPVRNHRHGRRPIHPHHMGRPDRRQWRREHERQGGGLRRRPELAHRFQRHARRGPRRPGPGRRGRQSHALGHDARIHGRLPPHARRRDRRGRGAGGRRSRQPVHPGRRRYHQGGAEPCAGGLDR